MSRAAAEQYEALARQYDIALPPILAGHALPLLPEGAQVSLHLFDEENMRLPALKISHKELVSSTYGFVRGVSRAYEPDLPRTVHPGMQRASGRAAGAAWPKLRPSGYKAGHVDDFTIEALAKNEIPEATRERLEAARQRLGEVVVPGCEVYLLTSARLHAGRTLGRVGCVTGVFMGYADDARTKINDTPSVVGVDLPVNEGLRASGEWQSRAIGRLLYGFELRRPLQGGLPGLGADQ